MNTNDIGLEFTESKDQIKMQNGHLANYQIYYQNLRNFHYIIEKEKAVWMLSANLK
ncbi:starvation-inducible DNA-binding protein [Algoriphagus alkaliphilus]|uniref:Starvation-inducible DNA-binding protein n=1 Tax=Algoriphagus alkaliphilus TaxID=279824 RepID=A0A1G5XPY6_9BACT|nr:hypothetical protein [Algoriphagus alkaliphilus]SDA72549.1 starvation-inducible DNA-binding protein [Algoriphagus alkaliphilus]